MKTLRKLLGGKGVLIAGILIILFWLSVMVGVDLFTSMDPYDMVGMPLAAPDSKHFLGTDALGRDVFIRTLYGARYTVPVAVVVVGCSLIIGVLLGAIGGYFGGMVDNVIMRFLDVTLAFPPILLAMAIAATLGNSFINLAIALIAVTWPVYARLMRSNVLVVKNADHVMAAKAVGVKTWRRLFHYVMPLCWGPVLIYSTVGIGEIILLAAALSFIGLGSTPPTPEWGLMIAEGADQFYDWWIAFGPGVAILSIVIGFNLVGDGLRDLFDVKVDL